jgi:hypothetical protein
MLRSEERIIFKITNTYKYENKETIKYKNKIKMASKTKISIIISFIVINKLPYYTITRSFDTLQFSTSNKRLLHLFFLLYSSFFLYPALFFKHLFFVLEHDMVVMK